MGKGTPYKIDQPVDLPPGWDWVQWRVENVEEVARFLEPFEVRMKAIPGDQMLVQARFTGMDLQVSPGDVLISQPATDNEPARLGLIHSKNAIEHRESETLYLQNDTFH